MKAAVTFFIALAAAVAFVLTALDDPGYVVLGYTRYTVRMPLALFVLLLGAGFAALYLAFNFLSATMRSPAAMRRWRTRHRVRRAHALTVVGYAELIEGHWKRAERKLLARLPHHPAPLLNYLGAAYAAQQRDHRVARDRYLDDALARHPERRTAIQLTRARLHYQAGEISAARDVLEETRRNAPRNTAVARLLAEVYRRLGDWDSLLALLPSLSHLSALPPDQLAALSSQAYTRHISAALPDQGDPTHPLRALPAAQRKDPAVVAGYARQLLRSERHVPAEKILRLALNRAWDARLARLYGSAETPFTDDQIKLAQSWANKYGERPALTLTLARLYQRADQPRRAVDTFHRALATAADPETQAAARAGLGALLEALGEKDAALACYREGLSGAESGAAIRDIAALGDAALPHADAVAAETMPVVR